jgi:predicted metalloprotease with PDZ domain
MVQASGCRGSWGLKPTLSAQLRDAGQDNEHVIWGRNRHDGDRNMMSVKFSKNGICTVALSFFLAACSTPQKAQEEKNLIVSNLVLVNIDFEATQDFGKTVRVKIKVPGAVRLFNAPEDYGGAPIFTKYIENLEAISDLGKTYSAKMQGAKVLVESADSTPYTLQYTYRVPQRISGEVDQSLPNLDEHYGRIDNNTFVLSPEGLGGQPAQLSIRPPRGWRVATGWGEGTEFKIDKLSDLLSGMIALGDYEYSQEKIAGLDVIFAIKGNYPHDKLKEQFAKVLKSQIEIAGPLPTSRFLVVFQPTKNSCCKGTSLTNSLIVNVPADEEVDPFNFRLVGTTSHELFHQWNVKLVYPASEEGVYLFSEGFTNYFAVAALVRSGLIPPESFAWFLWHYRGLLEKNPKYKGTDFAKIQSGYKSGDAELIDLAYTRGPFVAVLLDLALREETSGQQSLTTWFRELTKEFGNRNGYTVADLRNLIAKVTGKPKGRSVKTFDDYFIGSKPIPTGNLLARLGITCKDQSKSCVLHKIQDPETRLNLFSADGHREKQVTSSATRGPGIISLKSDFQQFWSQAKGKNPAEQVMLWNKIIEKPHQEFYDFAVWEKHFRPGWTETKNKTLKSRFNLYPAIYSDVESAFDTFPSVVKTQIDRFQKTVPNSKIDFPIYAIVAPNFDAKSAIVSRDPKSVGLVIAIDSIVLEKANYDVLFPHELFHAYHALRSGFLNDGVMPDTSIAVPLWEEGLATYISGLVNAGVADGDLLLDPELRKVGKTDIKWLATKFLEQVDRKTLDPAPTEDFKSWFSTGKLKLRADLPNRCGYLLGLYVVREVAKNHSLDEMINWRPKDIREHVVAALEKVKNL